MMKEVSECDISEDQLLAELDAIRKDPVKLRRKDEIYLSDKVYNVVAYGRERKPAILWRMLFCLLREKGLITCSLTTLKSAYKKQKEERENEKGDKE